jgi:hypothetical protein
MHSSLRLLIALAYLPYYSFAAETQGPSPDSFEFSDATTSAFDRSGKLVTHHSLPDGTVYANHNGTMGHVMVARVGAGGKIETFCAEHEQQARNWMASKEKKSGTVIIQNDAGDQP